MPFPLVGLNAALASGVLSSGAYANNLQAMHLALQRLPVPALGASSAFGSLQSAMAGVNAAAQAVEPWQIKWKNALLEIKETLHNVFGPILERLAEWAVTSVEFIEGVADAFRRRMERIGQQWDWLTGKFGEGWQFIRNLWLSGAQWITDTWGNATTWVSDKWDSVTGGISNGVQFVMDKFRAMAQWFRDTWGNVFDWFADRWNWITSLIPGFGPPVAAPPGGPPVTAPPGGVPIGVPGGVPIGVPG
ncbi:MAG: hypothetical protein OXQ29_26315, partial [Rhodospirillaceae bacterium]|nr:hypothetical protein [Rhodospirillaceae bacterium]